MKRYFTLVTAIVLVLGLSVSCHRNEDLLSMTASSTELSFPGEGGSQPVSLTTNSESWTVYASESWISVTPASGRGNTELAVSVDPNAGAARKTALKVFDKSMPTCFVEISIAQAAKGETPGPDPDPDPDPEAPGRVIERSEFTESTTWGVTGSIMNLNWTSDLPMKGESTGWLAAFDVTVADGEEFKFRKDGAWTVNLGGAVGQPAVDHKFTLADDGANIKLPTGAYDLYMHPTYMILYVEKAGDTFAHGDAKSDQQEGENVRIYVLNNSTWKTPYMYAYVGSAGALQPYGTWPGTYAAGSKVIGDYTYTYWEASGFNGINGVNLILNDGGANQYPAPDETDELWSNLTIMSTLYFEWDGKKVTAIEDPASPGAVSGKGTEPEELEFGSSTWTLIGTLGGTNWDYDFPMDTEGYWEVAKGVSIAAGEQFKFRQNRKWDVNLGSGEYSDTGANPVGKNTKITLASGAGNMTVSASGTYDVYLCVENNIAYLLDEGATWTHEAEGKPDYSVSGQYDPNLPNSKKASGLTYQVNVFSFKDSDGDGYGDLNGITQSLDYFDKLGVTALWLSPVQPAQSYHGYDVTDYEAVNPRFGTEDDFRTLVTQAHKHNIRIYMDYVINHSGNENVWFKDVKENGPDSKYWSYYSLTKTPEADCKAGKIAQVDDKQYDSYKWFPVTIGGGGAHRYQIDLDWTNASAPKMTVTETTAAVTTTGTYNNPARYLYWGSGTSTQFVDNGTNKYRLVLDYESSWGCLIRTTTADDWSKGTKWGFNKTGDQMQLGVAHTLYDGESDAVKNIVMPAGETYYYYSEFGTGMFVDFNYGEAASCENSAAFKAVVASAEKWLKMGVDGFRLDAVKHIYHNETGSNNKTFWKKFYEACNKVYKANASARSGLSGIVDENIFMVGEVLSGDGDCTPFYEGLPALFEFQFWWDLRECLNGGTIYNAGYGQTFSSSLPYRWNNHRNVRSDAISTPKLANHDEDRTASTLGNSKQKIRLAACVLLTSAGRPYIYQGEELGYWGTKANGDEYVRTPILWTADQSSAAAKGVSNKVDWNMLSPSISVASQAEEETSLLMLYRRFGYARNVNPALSDGWPEADERTAGNYDGQIAGWYLHANDGSGKVALVLHNFSGYSTDVTRWPAENATEASILASNGHVTVSGSVDAGTTVTLPGYSSVVFALN